MACWARGARGLATAAAAAAAAPATRWQLVVGLEVHAQLLSRSKLFSGAAAGFGGAPNAQAAWLDAGLPGTLPALNRECVRHAVRIGLALNGQVQRRSFFQRKHYFYCDLPLGYQITQLAAPVVAGGELVLDDYLHQLDDGTGNLRLRAGRLRPAAAGEQRQRRAVRIVRVQLEQDSGKSLHDLHDSLTHVDLNRAGVGLVEIVTHPDMRSVEEASACVRKLQATLQHLHVCTAVMATGALRCDVNVSLFDAAEGEHGSRGLGQRVEVKNLRSIRDVEAAIAAEAQRQAAILDAGGEVARETRGFDAKRGATFPMRSKEELLDYRFLPDPDLPPLVVEESEMAELRRDLPELPESVAARLVRDFHLKPAAAASLMATPGAVAYFTAVVGEGTGRAPDRCLPWVTSVLLGQLQIASLVSCPLPPARLGEVVDLVEAGAVSRAGGRQLLSAMLDGDARPAAALAEALGLRVIKDAVSVERMVAQVLDAHANEVELIATLESTPVEAMNKKERGKAARLRSFLVGTIMQASGRHTDPVQLNAAFAEALRQRIAALKPPPER